MTLQIYHRHMTQRTSTDPYWQYNCSAYSAAMLINDATLGGMFGITGRRVRELSSEPRPDPASPGLNIPQIVQVAHKLNVQLTDQTGEDWAGMMASLNLGKRICAQVDYETLGPWRSQANGDFGHMLVLVKETDRGSSLVVSDPLAKDIKGIPQSVIRDAMRVFARNTGVATGLRWAMTRRIPLIEV